MAGHIEVLPFSDEADEEIALELAVKHLREEVQVGDESCLEDDGNVRGVEQLNGEWGGVSTDTSRLQSEFDSESLYN